MKKWLILIIVVLMAGIAWYAARQRTMIPTWLQPKFGKVNVGDIRVPITAAGLIHPNQLIEVKPEASGEIVRVPVQEGDFVHQGDVLVELNPSDEERSRDRAQADFDRAEALLRQAEVAVARADVSIASARSRVRELEAQSAITAYDLEKIKGWRDTGRTDLYNPQQINDAQARHDTILAQLDIAVIAVRAAELAKEDAEAQVGSQEATVRSVRKALEDAQERLSETTVLATQDGIVTEVFVRPGMLVQSGTQSLTGGTPLMRIADVSKKKVIARLDEADYGRVLDISPLDALPEMPALRETAQEDAESLEKRSGGVQILVDAFPDAKFAGRIERVEPQGKLNAGSSIIQFDVHVEITDDERHMLPLGAQAQVEFTVESAVETLRVPAEAVKSFEDQRGVWVRIPPERGSNEQFGKRFVPCRFGISDGEHTQVIEVLGGQELQANSEVYIKLPPSPDELRG